LAVTLNNASNNNTFLKELANICKKKTSISIMKNWVRCLAHIMNLAVQEILKYVRAGEAEEEDIILSELSSENNNNNNMEVIPKLRKLIVKIRSSPQKREKFSQHCGLYDENKKSLNLILDV
jgi:hypothetical protein